MRPIADISIPLLAHINLTAGTDRMGGEAAKEFLV